LARKRDGRAKRRSPRVASSAELHEDIYNRRLTGNSIYGQEGFRALSALLPGCTMASGPLDDQQEKASIRTRGGRNRDR
jgi:hypothetical protein